jgi:hypothetical protein
VSLIARHLEATGIPTVIIGSARDIVEECRVPRFVFTDLPLGNPCGPPGDTAAHDATLQLALDLIEGAPAPQTTVQSSLRWPTDDWRDSYMRVDDSNRAELLAAGEARRAKQRRAKG